MLYVARWLEMEQQMKRSESYIAVEKMIQLGEIMFSDLERLLAVLQRQERITASEHKALLELAWRMNANRIGSLLSPD